MEGDRNNNVRRPRTGFFSILNIFCLGKKDEEEEIEESFANYPHLQRQEGKAAKERKNESHRMSTGQKLPFSLTCMTPQEESLDSMTRAAGPPISNPDYDTRSITYHRDSVKIAKQQRRKRRLASRRSRTFYVPQSANQERPEIYDISLTYSPSDDEI